VVIIGLGPPGLIRCWHRGGTMVAVHGPLAPCEGTVYDIM
jgi:hypothetical protein